MTQEDTIAEAISLLQELGLKEYEARCFMALTQLSTGTAKEIHEISEVPRTRVYDAIRVLESQGLVEVQHTSPQRFRAATIDEATQTLKQKYESRIDTLESYLETTEVREPDRETDQLQEVWSLTGTEAIASRTLELIGKAESEIAFLVVDTEIMGEPVFDALTTAQKRDVTIYLGGQTDAITAHLGAELPGVQTFETELDWLVGPDPDHQVAISRILLIDRETLLIGSFYPDGDDETSPERAVFATGLENGVVVLLRRLIASGLEIAPN